ncbi:hypothetical protein [Constantimarinum furrinae]|uniref:Uncharacterized protein n=1 Tax=Constantimarinum furrinae TaxID=2562285 RepID=A0A7G8PQX3_9FLAO|nr:hypothetical protein [Constantimarinum furrinae]QNJ96739.1 hypothetical protein ALE3EI_0149 [Constantimarinum furrinae]
MEKQFDKDDAALKRIIKTAGREQPSVNFVNDVMQRIAMEKEPAFVYKPLFSKQAWVVVAALFVFAIGTLYFSPLNIFNADQFDFAMPSLQFDLPQIQLSNTFLYGIAFLSLFLIQIPFLKKFTSEENR